MKGWIVYIVRCGDCSFYTGVTNDLAARVAAHNAGRGARYTRSRRPVRLVWCERRRDRRAALRREAEIKSWSRAEKIRRCGLEGRISR
ncbi:MAG: GIY-YIG nuclease family protein [Planctomycetes bacterium]|nr:GIY-YIG nuclease family protein [Planctomycetota bacterium]